MGTIRIETNGSASVEVKIYDLAGYFVQSFKKEYIQYGINIFEFTWDTSDVTPGVYFAHISAKNGDKNQNNILKIAVVE